MSQRAEHQRPRRKTLARHRRAQQGTVARPRDARSALEPVREQPSSTNGIPVVWEGGFFETHSLALVNRELVRGLLTLGGVDVSLRLRELESPKFDPSALPDLAPLLERLDRALDGKPTVYVRHAWPPVFDTPQARKWVMIQPWEYGRLPVDWVEPMRDRVDEIWAYTETVRRFYIDSGVPGEKIHRVPLGVDPARFRPDARPVSLPTDKKVRFLFVGGTIWRKGIDVLLDAYIRTFRRRDDVSLIVKDMGQDSFYKGQTAEQAIARIQADPEAPEILYVTGSLRDDEIAGLYTAATCLVHPYRGEGFGLPVAEAMACGLPAIVTAGGATDDFCGDRSFPVLAARRDFNLSVPTAGPAWILEPNRDSLMARMREVYEDPARASEMGKAASRWVRTHLTWDAAAMAALTRIRSLAGLSSDDAAKDASAPALSGESRSTTPPIRVRGPAGEPPADSEPTLVWNGLVFSPSRYASQLRSSVQALRTAGMTVRLEELHPDSRIEIGLANDDVRLLRSLFEQDAASPYIRVWHCAPNLFGCDAHALANVGKTLFETDSLPADLVEACNRMDQVWVSSPFNVDTFGRAGVERRKLQWIPDCLDESRFGLHVAPLDLETGRSFNFLSIFEWMARKGWDVLIRAFAEEFAPDEDVALVVQAYPTSGKTMDGILADIRGCVARQVGDRAIAPIRFLAGVMAETDMPRLYRAAGAYVQPHRGEGWGRTLMEAMATGLPTIGTRWSAPLTFMNDANSFLLDYKLVDVPQAAIEEQPYYAGQRWAEPSVEHLRMLMRQVFENHAEARKRGEQAARDIAQRFNPAVVGARLRQVVDSVISRQSWTAAVAAPPQQTPVAFVEPAASAIPVRWKVAAGSHPELAVACMTTGSVDVCLVLDEPNSHPELAPMLDRELGREPAVCIFQGSQRLLADLGSARAVLLLDESDCGIPSWAISMSRAFAEVWVPSQAARREALENGFPSDKIHVIPSSIHPGRFHPSVPPLPLGTRKSFRFLCRALGAERNSLPAVLQAYSHTFTRRDDVCLVVEDPNVGQDTVERIAALQLAPDAPEVLHLTRHTPDGAIAGLYTACHCLLHLERGGGSVLPVARAMACGLAVVVPASGPAADFCTAETSFRLPAQGLAAEAEPAALAAYMRAIYDAPGLAARKGVAASEWVRKNLTWEASAIGALKRFRALAAGRALVLVENGKRPAAVAGGAAS